MKRFMICAQALALCLCGTPVQAEFSHWQWLYPNVQGKSLYSIDVVHPASAFAVGQMGTVVMTTDGGLTWKVRPTIPGLPNLIGVSAVTPSTLIAVGSGGMILRSVNGARTWNAVVSGTPADLWDVDFHGMTNGLAVGTNGTILRSDDAGVTWTLQTSGTTETLYGLRMVDDVTATAVGSGGTILKTTDGGVNWAPQTSGTLAGLTDVDFYGTDTGMVVGGTTVLITADGGTNWLPAVTPLPVPNFTARAVDVRGFLHAVVVGTWGPGNDCPATACTFDGGVAWSVSSELFTSGLSGVLMFTSSEGVAIGGAGMIRRTTDGGVTWPQVAGGHQRFGMQRVNFLDSQHGVAVSAVSWQHPLGPNTRSYCTTDGGATWRRGRPTPDWDPYYPVYDGSFADANTVYLVGHGMWMMDEGGMIWRSTDGGPWEMIFGSSCSPDQPACVGLLSAVDFAGSDAGVAVGDGNGLVTILDGAAAFVPLPMYVRLNGVSVPTPMTAYAAGDGGLVLKGDLVGGSWVELTSGTTEGLSAVSFVDDMTGWVAGTSGTILHTSDGGDSWIPQTSGTTATLNSVSFIDAANGLIGTDGAMILKTRDGGETWVPEETVIPIADVDFVDPFCAVAVGGMENIIMHIDGPVPVFFQDISASVRPYSVELRWAVYADEAIQGFRVYRSAGGAGEVALTSELLAPVERSFIDRDVVPGSVYEYSVAAFDESGAMIRSRPVWVSVPDASATLLQNSPNPFNPTTRIRFTLPARTHVTLSVFDVAGRWVTTLVDGTRAPGEHDVTWDGKDRAGNSSPSGIYFYELRTPDSVFARKMVLIK